MKLVLQVGRVTFTAELTVAAARPPDDAPPPPSGITVEAPAEGAWWPSIRVGHHVRVGQAIGTVVAGEERLKVESLAAGVVAELLASHGQAVAFGQPLLRLEPAGSP